MSALGSTGSYGLKHLLIESEFDKAPEAKRAKPNPVSDVALPRFVLSSSPETTPKGTPISPVLARFPLVPLTSPGTLSTFPHPEDLRRAHGFSPKASEKLPIEEDREETSSVVDSPLPAKRSFRCMNVGPEQMAMDREMARFETSAMSELQQSTSPKTADKSTQTDEPFRSISPSSLSPMELDETGYSSETDSPKVKKEASSPSMQSATRVSQHVLTAFSFM